MKKVLGNRVLIEQIMTKKESSLLLTDKQKQDTQNFDIERKIIMLGDEVTTVDLGDIPIFSKYGEPEAVMIISKDDDKMVSHIIMSVEDIVGLEEIEIK